MSKECEVCNENFYCNDCFEESTIEIEPTDSELQDIEDNYFDNY